MKKLLCLLLSVAVCITLFTGCGKFDVENADISEYVTLSDISDIPYENLVKAYEDYREYLSQDMKSCALSTGYTIDFLVKAELLDEKGNATETIEKWTHNTENDMVKGYDVYKTPSLFDDALMYTVTEAGAQSSVGRTVEIGKEFFFTMKMAEDYEDEALAGKTVKFTLNVQKVLPAVYPDSYITERLNSFFKAAKVSKETIGIGDTVTLDIKGTIDGKVFEDGTVSNFMCVIGEGNLNEDFESNLIGHSLNERFEFTLTLSEDYDDTLAGKEVLYSVKVKDIYNDNEIIQNATGFANMWELKYALRVESYISYALVTYVEDQSNLISYPEKLLKRFEKIFENYVRRDVAERVLEYAEYGYSYTKKEMRALIYPDGADVTYIEEGSKAAAYSYLIAVAIQRELGLEYSEKDYNRDLKLIAEEYTTYYEETYTTKDIVSLYGEEVLYTSFLVAFLTEHLMERVSGMPKIPG